VLYHAGIVRAIARGGKGKSAITAIYGPRAGVAQVTRCHLARIKNPAVSRVRAAEATI